MQPKHKSLQLDRSLPWLAVNGTSPSEWSQVEPLAESELFRAFVCAFLRTQRTLLNLRCVMTAWLCFIWGLCLARKGPIFYVFLSNFSHFYFSLVVTILFLHGQSWFSMKIHCPSRGTPLEDFPASSVATGPHHGQWSRRETDVASWPIINSHRHFSKSLPLLLMDTDGDEIFGMEVAKDRSLGSWMTTWWSAVSPGWTPTQHCHVGNKVMCFWNFKLFDNSA